MISNDDRLTAATAELADALSASRDIRCHCGSLVARITDGKVEIKCRRCQRIGLIDITKLGIGGQLVDVQWLSQGAKTKPK